MVSYAHLILVFYRLQVTKYLHVASLSILVYDYLLTLDREVSLIWRSSWGIGKVMYLIARYSALIDTPWSIFLALGTDIPYQSCYGSYVPCIWSAVFGLACAEAILFLRTSALYSNIATVSFALFSVWLSVLITCIVITSVWLRTVTFGPPPSALWTGCFETGGTRLVYANYVALLLQETIIVALTLYRAVRTGLKTNDRLVKTLYRDGFYYFLYLLIIAVANIIVLAAGPPELIELIAPFQRIIHAVFTTRVLLHARGAASNHREVTVTDLRFAATAVLSNNGTVSAISHVDVEQHQSESDSTTEAQSSVAKTS